MIRLTSRQPGQPRREKIEKFLGIAFGYLTRVGWALGDLIIIDHGLAEGRPFARIDLDIGYVAC